MRSFRIFILMALLMTAFVVNAHAAVMTFTHESAMSGHIGATYFTNARFIISAVGDTENRKSGGWYWYIPHDSATIYIEGVGTYDIYLPTSTFCNTTSGMVGFKRLSGSDLCDGPFSNLFKNWDMLSSIGPLSGYGGMNPWNPVQTSGGDLYMVGGRLTVVTFTATLNVDPDIDVSPIFQNFGNVQWGHTSTAWFTISNVGGGDLMISEISLPDTPVEFSITYKPPLPVVLGAGQYTEVEVTFSPNATQLYTGFLLITSDDPDESLFPVTLSGNGVIADTPSEQVAYVINFIQESISTGALTGEGPGNSADKKVNALINMIKAYGDLLVAGQTVEGCQQLADLYLKVDGVSPPPDFLSGEATDELAGAIQEIMTYYECQ